MRRELVATVGDQEIEIHVDRSDNEHWQLVIDGKVRDVDAKEIRPGVWSLLCEGRSYLIDLDRRKTGTAIVRGTTEAMAQIEDARQKRLAQAVAGQGGAGQRGEVVSAPIAGKVVKLLVSAGDKVEAGQSVGVLEAMKMENEIKAERGGEVKAIHVSAGQSVDTGDKMMTLA